VSFFVQFNCDSRPISIETLRGIERQDVAILGGSGQTVFARTNYDYDRSNGQSAELSEGRVRIIGRARLDDREALCRVLNAPLTDRDELLCLRSYVKWNVQCLEHLQGDFCFVIWDGDRQQLLCARDQLGVRPLFYSQNGDAWLISDVLESIRLNCTLASDLDDFWIADFLTANFCLDPERSVYRDIRRLPAAHALIVSANQNKVHSYWTLNIEAPVFYRDQRQYVDHLHELLAMSIRDRLPDGRVGVAMSGGLDSSMLAAKAVVATGDASRVVAETRYFEHLIPDREKHFSSLTAKRLGIQHMLRPMDDACYDRFWENRGIRTPEPTTAIISAVSERAFGSEMAKHARVWFYGEGPDNALAFEWRSYLGWLCRQKDWARLGATMVRYLFTKQPREWLTTFNIRTSRQRDEIALDQVPPKWMQQALVTKIDHNARLRNFDHSHLESHPWHPRAVASFQSAIWPSLLEGFDSPVTGVPIEWRHPYLDLRVLRFLLSVPPIPWARNKLLIRKAMQGMLPNEIILRKKEPLGGFPITEMIHKNPLSAISLSDSIHAFVDEAYVPNKPGDTRSTNELVRIRALDFWLRNR
jgi:asparagine synthase (glutamine-hydrolysing)